MSDLRITIETFRELNMPHPKKAAADENTTTKELNLISESIGSYLLSLCTQSYLDGKLLTNWKIGKLKPVYRNRKLSTPHHATHPQQSLESGNIRANRQSNASHKVKIQNGHTRTTPQQNQCYLDALNKYSANCIWPIVIYI